MVWSVSVGPGWYSVEMLNGSLNDRAREWFHKGLEVYEYDLTSKQKNDDGHQGYKCDCRGKITTLGSNCRRPTSCRFRDVGKSQRPLQMPAEPHPPFYHLSFSLRKRV